MKPVAEDEALRAVHPKRIGGIRQATSSVENTLAMADRIDNVTVWHVEQVLRREIERQRRQLRTLRRLSVIAAAFGLAMLGLYLFAR